MVDINLLKDDDEDEKEEGKEKGKENAKEKSHNDKDDLSSGLDEGLDFNDEEMGGDLEGGEEADFNLDDELGGGLDEESEQDLDKEFGEEASLEDEGFLDDELGEEEEIPDLEGKKENDEDTDYSVGEVKKKGVSPFLLILLVIVIIVGLGYQFVYLPKVKALKDMQNNVPKQPDMQTLIEQRRQKQLAASKKDSIAGAEIVPPEATQKTTTPEPTGEEKQMVSTNIKPITLVQNTGSLIAYLSQNNSLGTIIIDIDDNYFRAGYASLTPNVGTEIAAKIKTIFNVDKYELSPEDSYKTNGTIRYWGLISGELSGEVLPKTTSIKKFQTAQSLQQWLETTAKNNSLQFREGEIFPAKTESGSTSIPLRIKVEGVRTNLVNYLTLVMQNSGNYRVNKMIITPVNITDFKGETIKFVINLTLTS
ncbi:MAG: hypothetical protein P8078_01850 [bacterium]